MASVKYERSSSERSRKRSDSSDDENKQRSFENQQNRVSKESAKILKHLTGNAEKSKSKFSFTWSSKTERLPHRYYINNNQTELLIIQGDITKTKVDAIVNAANQHMTGGSGVDGIIHQAAGDSLYDACRAHKEIRPGVRVPTGHSRILLSYDMAPTTYYIINTAGPIYNRGAAKACAEKLSSCYRTALALANLYDLESIAFTAISCGIFGYPADDGADVALRTVDKEADSMPVVVFVLWDDHIYDAWIKKAKELGFILVGNDSAPAQVVVNPSKRLNDDDKSKPIETALEKSDDVQLSNKSFDPKVPDLSQQETTDKTPDPNVETLSPGPTSVPYEETDTQQTVEMEENNDIPIDNSRLETQKTMEMTDANQKEETKTTNDGSEQQSVQEEGGKINNENSKTDQVSGSNINQQS